MHGILYLLYHQTVCVFLSIQKYILKEILIPEQPIITFDLIFNDIVRIRLHEYVCYRIVFIETTNLSLRFHLASTRKRSKTIIVFTELNANFWKRFPTWKDLETMSMLFSRIVFTENANF